jgi:mono/diheme cytochrome c family protein
MNKWSRLIRWGLGGAVGIVVLLTIGALLLETNPPVKQEPSWDSSQTKVLAQRACYDCHGNETAWPIYTKLPVGSWLAVFDTVRARRVFNLSEWGTVPIKGDRGSGVSDVVDVINDGSMPPSLYTLMHPDAILTAPEKQQLIQGFQKSLK